MNTVFETTFTVMPSDANYMTPLIFGGAFFSHLDLCAAQTCNRLLHDSKTCVSAVTHKSEVEFAKPTYVGDLIFLRGEVVSLGKKSIVVDVTADREKRGVAGRDRVARAKFVFISISDSSSVISHPDMLPYSEHGLTLPQS